MQRATFCSWAVKKPSRAAKDRSSGSLHAAHDRCFENRRARLGSTPDGGSSTSCGNRLAKSFRFITSRHLLPARDGKSRVVALEILKSTLRTLEYLEKGDHQGETLLTAMLDRDTEGMQHFDGSIE